IKNNKDKYIFISKNGNPISIQAYNQSLRAVSKELNLDKKVSSHMLRHSHISLLTELGIPLKAIMDRVGHEDSKTTLKIYTHTTKKYAKSTSRKTRKNRNLNCPFSAPYKNKQHKIYKKNPVITRFF
ncbi:TPA: tyrosine-type recombinase/integrase, partial [Enterococcus faecium]